ncbi:thrombospondin-4-like [Tropilaelaps mercedesae]|uniref:Thrombospondin-4-like n=1 Tax=Tropilaelaps mercedesae TaxID=418985 RepID=A0A1V9X1L4_9ACAR|nr:thrombospondin-4-like [Tropilaelaps mercedesae]
MWWWLPIALSVMVESAKQKSENTYLQSDHNKAIYLHSIIRSNQSAVLVLRNPVIRHTLTDQTILDIFMVPSRDGLTLSIENKKNIRLAANNFQGKKAYVSGPHKALPKEIIITVKAACDKLINKVELYFDCVQQREMALNIPLFTPAQNAQLIRVMRDRKVTLEIYANVSDVAVVSRFCKTSREPGIARFTQPKHDFQITEPAESINWVRPKPFVVSSHDRQPSCAASCSPELSELKSILSGLRSVIEAQTKATNQLRQMLERCGHCPDGMTGNGTHCDDFDECTLGNPCFPGVNCINLRPGFSCGPCPRGYTGRPLEGIGADSIRLHKQQCFDVNECDDGNNGGCVENSVCINTQGGFRCGDCIEGFVGNQTAGCRTTPGLCPDSTECDGNAECYMRRGHTRFQCRCKIGFAGDGRLCAPDRDIDGWPDYALPCFDKSALDSVTGLPKFDCVDLPAASESEIEEFGRIVDVGADSTGVSSEDKAVTGVRSGCMLDVPRCRRVVDLCNVVVRRVVSRLALVIGPTDGRGLDEGLG